MLHLMEALRNLPTTITQPTYDFPDRERRSSACSLLVDPHIGWAIATQLVNKGATVLEAAADLAGKICEDFQIVPDRLLLLARYTQETHYAAGITVDRFYLLQFGRFEKGAFGAVAFHEAHHYELSSEQAEQVLTALARPAATPPALWRAWDPAGSANRLFRLV